MTCSPSYSHIYDKVEFFEEIRLAISMCFWENKEDFAHSGFAWVSQATELCMSFLVSFVIAELKNYFSIVVL